MNSETTSKLNEARALLGVRWECSNEDLLVSIDDWVKQLLAPLVEAGNADASYLLGALSDSQSAEDFDEILLQRYKEGAEAEIPEAMFYLAHWHWERSQHTEAAQLYAKAANAGHVHAIWCHGLDLLSGTGVENDVKAGLAQIEKAAELKFEGAIQFMVKACAFGQYGVDKDEGAAARWQKMLSLPDLVHY